VRLDWVDDDNDGVGRMLRDVCTLRRVPWHEVRNWERPVVRRFDGRLSLDRTLNAKARGEIRRRQRRLEERLGAEVEIRDRSDSSAVDEFLQLEVSGWKGRGGTAYANRPEAELWFREMCKEFESRGKLHFISLESGGRSLEMQCFLREGTTAFSLRVGHDAELDRFGPGVPVHAAAVEFFEGTDVELIDSRADSGNEYWSRIYPDRRRMVDLIIAPGNIVDRTAVRLLPVLAFGRTTLARSKTV